MNLLRLLRAINIVAVSVLIFLVAGPSTGVLVTSIQTASFAKLFSPDLVFLLIMAVWYSWHFAAFAGACWSLPRLLAPMAIPSFRFSKVLQFLALGPLWGYACGRFAMEFLSRGHNVYPNDLRIGSIAGLVCGAIAYWATLPKCRNNPYDKSPNPA